MKQNGEIRRFDDLGRIVIPKWIRQRLEIREGQTMDVYVDSENRIVLQKFEAEED